MLTACFCIAAGAFLVHIFANSKNGRILHMIYSVLCYISMTGINSGLMNIVFDYSKEENAKILLGVTTSMGGICGFAASLVGGNILVINCSSGANNVVITTCGFAFAVRTGCL